MTPFTSCTQWLDTAPQLAPNWFKENVKGGPTNCIPCKEVSVQTNIAPLDLTAAIILEPSCILKEPAVFVAEGNQVLKSSWEEKRKNNGSDVEEVPIVVSVPNKNTCLSTGDTKVNLDVVGALGIIAAGVPKPTEVSHLNVPPSLTVAIRSSPKLSKDHCLPSILTVDVDLGVFQVPEFQAPVPHP